MTKWLTTFSQHIKQECPCFLYIEMENMNIGLKKNKQLESKKLLGIVKIHKKSLPITTTPLKKQNRNTLEKTLLEAEFRKAEAITIIRRYGFR